MEAVTQECLVDNFRKQFNFEHQRKSIEAGEGDTSECTSYEETAKEKVRKVNRAIQQLLIASKKQPPTETSDEPAKRRRMELESNFQEVKENALQAQKEQCENETIRPEPLRWSRAQDLSGIHKKTATRTSTQWLEYFVSRMRANPFNGDPKEWPSFIANFETFVHDTTLHNKHKLLILGDVLYPDIKKRMAHLLQTPGTYERAVQELRQKYEGVQQLVRYHIQHLILLPSCRQGDHPALYEFLSELHDTVTTLQALEQVEKLSY